MAKVIVVDHDHSWSDTFEQLRARIWPCIEDLATSVEHVGSTSVKGLAAKPIIDMTVVVPMAPAMEHVIGRLATIGYQHRGDLGVPGREAFAFPPGTPNHHLYACVAGSDCLRNHLAVRSPSETTPPPPWRTARSRSNWRHNLPTISMPTSRVRPNSSWGYWRYADFSPDQIATIRAINKKPKEAG